MYSLKKGHDLKIPKTYAINICQMGAIISCKEVVARNNLRGPVKNKYSIMQVTLNEVNGTSMMLYLFFMGPHSL